MINNRFLVNRYKKVIKFIETNLRHKSRNFLLGPKQNKKQNQGIKIFHEVGTEIFIYCSLGMSLALLVSCSRVPQNVSSINNHSALEKNLPLAQLKNWQTNGVFSFRDNQHSIIAAYDWQQSLQHYRIDIRASLGVYSATLVGQPGKVIFWRGNKIKYAAANPEELMQQQLGWSLPINNLYYWIRGLSAPGIYQAHYDAAGHLLTLIQNGWNIAFSQYFTAQAGTLPGTLTISNPPISIKIVIKNFSAQ